MRIKAARLVFGAAFGLTIILFSFASVHADIPPFPAQTAASGQKLKAWEKKAIPVNKLGAPTALDYHHVPFDKDNPLAGDPLVDIADYGLAGESFYARTDGLNAPYYRAIPGAQKRIYCRRAVAQKLQGVNATLRPLGVEVFVLDAWRSVPVQQSLWDYFLEKARRLLHTDDSQKLRAYAGKFCSNPSGFSPHDERTWPTHVTGGAVDLTLRRLSGGEHLFMGSIFDDASPESFTDAFEKRISAGNISGQTANASDLAACRNRRLLFWAMKNQGFANYPYEWWHFDYGTQMWAINQRPAVKVPPLRAFFGVASQP